MVHIAVIASSLCKSESLREYAQKLFSDFDLSIADGHSLSRSELIAVLSQSHAAVIGRDKIDDEVLSNTPHLRALSIYGVGFDNVDIEACKRHGVTVLIRPGVNAQAVAEHTLGLILSALRNIAYCDRLLHSGIWHKDGGFQLAGKRVAVIGVGYVGKAVARLLKAFDCEVLLHDILDISAFAEEISAKTVSFNHCLESADIISVHVPLTALTKHLFDAKAFSHMRPGTILINTSRGGVVKLSDLKIAIENGKLRGAGLDVFEDEPLTDPGIYSLDKLVLTPHIAGNAREAVQAMGKAALDLLKDYFLQTGLAKREV